MDKLNKVKEMLLNGEYTFVAMVDGNIITSTKRGISPMMQLIAENISMKNAYIADKIVGKAVAMLFIKENVKEVYADTLSTSALEILNKYNIKTSYGTLTEKIINRDGTDICPMEKTVEHISDVNEAYDALKQKLESFKSREQQN